MYMPKRMIALIVLVLTVVMPVSVYSRGPSPDATRIIDELSLREAKTPVSEHPRWMKPSKVAVYMPSRFADRKDDFVAAYSEASGGAEIVIIENFQSDLDKIADADVFIGFCNKRVLEAGKAIRWMHTYSVGVDRCTLLPEIDQYDFILTNNQRLSGPDIAEHAIAMLMALARNLDAYHRNQLANNWQRGSGGPGRSLNLDGRTMLVLGLGGIGTEIARRANALGVRVVATRNSSRSGPDFVDYVGLSDEMHELAGKADFIMNALPLTAQTNGIVDKKFFDAVRPGAYYVNVGRGKTTVTDDLVAALNSGQLAGAGLDVTDPEPLPEDHVLWQMPGVLITPHIAASTVDAPQRSFVIAVENLRRYSSGDKLLNLVDIRRGY